MTARQYVQDSLLALNIFLRPAKLHAFIGQHQEARENLALCGLAMFLGAAGFREKGQAAHAEMVLGMCTAVRDAAMRHGLDSPDMNAFLDETIRTYAETAKESQG